MTKQEKAAIYRDVNKHSDLGLESPVGEVNEEELKNLAGAKNVNQEEPLSSFIPGPGTCLTAAICPTTGMCNIY